MATPAISSTTPSGPVSVSTDPTTAPTAAMPAAATNSTLTPATETSSKGIFATICSVITAMKDGIVWGVKTAIYYLSCKMLCKSVAPVATAPAPAAGAAPDAPPPPPPASASGSGSDADDVTSGSESATDSAQDAALSAAGDVAGAAAAEARRRGRKG